jgi:hypothetical protein
VILDIKRNFFFGIFWNIDPVLVTLINLLLKPKMHIKTYFIFEIFYVVWDYSMIFFIFEKLGRMHENKAFCVCVYNFYIVSMKTGYFNTNFVFL